jgi:hypothetical protein
MMPDEIYLRGRYIGKMQDANGVDAGCTRYTRFAPEVVIVENVPDNESSKLAYIMADCMTNFDTTTISGGLFAAHQAMQIIAEKYPNGLLIKQVKS